MAGFMKLQDMGTSGLACYVREGSNGRAKNARRMHVERVLAARFPNNTALVIERFRNLIASPLPGVISTKPWKE